MKKPIVTVTVGMPAYNESENIVYVLQDILRQQCEGYAIEKIIVASDGSSDATCELARGVGDSRIVVFENMDRQGPSARQNQILESTTSDILVLINADIAMPDEHFISHLIAPIISSSADLTSCKLIGAEPSTFIERVINASVEVKSALYESIRSGNCVYTCYGAARAFSRNYYTQMKFGDSVGEDAYSYLKAVHDGFNYQYVKNTHFIVRLPGTLKDHFRQSIRYNQSRERFITEFGQEFVAREYTIPLRSYFHALYSTVRFYPFLMIVYLAIFLLCWIKTRYSNVVPATWDIASGTKRLR